MERNGGFQRYQSCKATAGNSCSTWHSAEKTLCSFSVFIPAPFAHGLHSLTYSEQHTAGNDTYSIIHPVLSSFPFLFFQTCTLYTPSLSTTQTYKAPKYTHVLFLFLLQSQTYQEANTHTKHTNKLWNKILRGVADTWSNACVIPKGVILDTKTSWGREKWRRQSRELCMMWWGKARRG